MPGQYFDAETGLNYNMARDYDPATGRYLESDPIGLNGGADTFAYAKDNPVMGIDPSGLFSLTVDDSWETVNVVPKDDGTPNPDGLGRTDVIASRDVSCECERNCRGSWVLGGCHVDFHILVKIKAHLPDGADAFSRHSESQHVLDLADSAGRIKQMGNFIENEQRDRTFTTEAECKSAAEQRMKGAMKALVGVLFDESRRRWDLPGLHKYHSPYDPFQYVGF
jgi:RHS repeat-associated protein